MKTSLTLWALMIAVAVSAIGCASHRTHNLPPAQQLLEPGPGVSGPGPGVIPPVIQASLPGPAVAYAQPSVQVLFAKPDGMEIRWDVGGVGMFDSEPLIVPGRQNFPQGGIFQLKVTNVEGREAVELYPTLEVGPTTPRTEAYLAHNAVPVQFTEEDFDQVLAGNFVTKVIYLPDPEFQELALAGVETLVSTRLDPGVDPIVEADRRGTIMAVVRMGNKDLETPGTMEGGVMAAGFSPAHMAAMGSPFLPEMLPPYVAGVTAPQWGMPYSGTPIGLPGPPHIPLGGQAGLQKHVIKNHTPVHMPDPVSKFKIHVRQQPGYSYPKPPSRMWIREQNFHPPVRFQQPHYDMQQQVH